MFKRSIAILNGVAYNEIQKGGTTVCGDRWLKAPEIKYQLDKWEWKLEEPNYTTIECYSREDFERTKAMIEFCTNYENESFELFYKWFVKHQGKED